MKKLIAVLAVMFSIDAAAYTGTGNDRISEAREYMRSVAGGADINYLAVGWWIGAVSGLSEAYGLPIYKHQVCYPKGTTTGQLAEIAAGYLIDHPEKRADPFWSIVWESHFAAFGLADKNCWRNTVE